MNHADHVNLIREGISGAGHVWADLGAGTGAFTLALAELLGPAAHIYAVDRSSHSLRELERAMLRSFPETRLGQITADFTQPLELPALDGIVAANALHFVRDKGPVLGMIHNSLDHGGRLVIVEYNTDRGNQWVPFPMQVDLFVTLASQAGFVEAHQLAARPSRFLGEIYSAVAYRGLANEER